MTTKLPRTPAQSAAIPNLDPLFGPDAPTLPDAEPPADLMLQNPDIIYAMQILNDVVVGDRADVFVDTNSIVYYDPTNRNRRVQPDVYIAFNVDADTIRRRNGYLIWEVGKPPDFVLEVASESTADNDTGWKRDLYARLGVPEYWRFDRTGRELYGAGLAGEYLENGVYRPATINTDADGVEWGYSRLLHLNLRHHEGSLELQDPNTGEVLLNRRGERLAKEAALEQRYAALQERDEQIRQLEERLAEFEETPE